MVLTKNGILLTGTGNALPAVERLVNISYKRKNVVDVLETCPAQRMVLPKNGILLTGTGNARPAVERLVNMECGSVLVVKKQNPKLILQSGWRLIPTEERIGQLVATIV